MKWACVLIFLYFVRHTKCESEVNTTTTASGPYRVSLVRVGPCQKTSYPIDPDPSIKLHLEVTNSTKKNVLSGNLTVIREQKQIKMKMKSFMWQNGKWKMTYLMSNIGCHGLLLHMLLSAVGIKYDRETCRYIKGQYYFRDMDIDPIQHIWARKMEYGRILWTTEATSRSITIYCAEFETLVEPLDSS